MGLGSFLDAIKVWVEGLIGTMGYPGLGLVMFLENIFPPIPSEVVLPLAGSLTLTGKFNLLWVTLVGMSGSIVGAFVFYGLGHWLGEKRVRELIARFGKFALLTTADFDTSLAWFNRYGEWVIFFGRMVPIVRSLISIPAGVASMNILHFSILTALGTALWSFVLSFAGALLGSQWRLIVDFIDQYQKVVLVFGFVVVFGFVLYRLRERIIKPKQP
jgi:membrane protein DedA with SNARE-associated domain